MVFKGPLLLLMALITFGGGININRDFRSELRCPQMRRRNPCDPEGSFKRRMTGLQGAVDSRGDYLKKLEYLEEKVEEVEKYYAPIKAEDVENINSLSSKVSDMEKEMKEILSLLTDNEFDNNPKNTEDSSERSKDKSQGAVKLEEIGKLEDRMAKTEERLSKLTNSNTLGTIEYMNELLGNTINKFTPKINKLDTLEIDLDDIDHVKYLVSYVNQSYSGKAQDLQAMEGRVSDTNRKSLKWQRNFLSLSNIQSASTTQKFEKDLQDFIATWTETCSHSENPCLPLTEKHVKFLTNPDAEHSNTLLEKVTPQVVGSLFWGCTPILPETFPNVVIRRHWREKKITFSCAKNEVLTGPSFTECRNRKWRPYPKPICNPRFTYLSIPSCPEIKLDGNSSLIFRVNEEQQFIQFDCPEGHALRGPSTFWCRNGSWVPKMHPMTECYTL